MKALRLAFNAVQSRLRKHFGTHLVPDYHGRSSHKQRDLRRRDAFGELAGRTIAEGRTLLYYDRLFTIDQAIENAVRGKAVGEQIRFAEVGVYRGGTSSFILGTAQRLGAEGVVLHSFDTFEGHPSADLRPELEPAHTSGMFGNTSYDQVKAYLSGFPNVTLHRGRVQDTAPAVAHETFSFVHLDVDIYEPTVFGLAFFGARLHVGGMMVVDDFGFTTCPGASLAVNEFIAANRDYAALELLTGQCVLFRHSDGNRDQ